MSFPLVYVCLIFAVAGLSRAEEKFSESKNCQSCHSLQHSEWSGSMMNFAAQSGVFQATELTVRKLTGRFGHEDEKNPTFCINCHSPVGAYHNDLLKLGKDRPTIEALRGESQEGISCLLCHSSMGPSLVPEKSKGRVGDGIGNASLDFSPTEFLVGPTEGGKVPQAHGKYHAKGFEPDPKAAKYLKSSEFCGACHDVRLPDSLDKRTREPFQREQNTYTEWKESVYATNRSPFGKVIQCQGCHMSQYGLLDPKTKKTHPPDSYPIVPVADSEKSKPRRHAVHTFHGVSLALGGSDTFAKDAESVIDGKFPKGLAEQRQLLLKKALTLTIPDERNVKVTERGEVPLAFTITNTGAGHRVPTGLATDRELWVEVVVRNRSGEILYETGRLNDVPHPETGEASRDGRYNDEDLNDVKYVIDPKTMEISQSRLGYEFNLRPFANLGLPQFSNAFLRQRGNGTERVAAFFLADQVDNERSIPILKPITVEFAIPENVIFAKSDSGEETISVEIRVRYRTFHPYFLRALAVREPKLVSESMIDQNTIVTLTESKFERRIIRNKEVARWRRVPSVSPGLGIYQFAVERTDWKCRISPQTQLTAKHICEAGSDTLPTVEDFEQLRLRHYSPKITDNHDELAKERWTSERGKTPDSGRTYTFTRGESAVGEATSSGKQFFCCIRRNSK